MPQVVIYTKAHCGHCRRAKALLEELDLDFLEIPVDEDDERRAEMVRLSGRDTVPQVFIGGRHVGGGSELGELESSGKLDELLGRRT